MTGAFELEGQTFTALNGGPMFKFNEDKYGASWQVVPRELVEMITDPDSGKSQRVMGAMLQMKKIDMAGLRRAYAG